MRVHNQDKKLTIRIQAKRGAENDKVTLEGCTLSEAVEFVKSIIMKRGSPLPDGMRTSAVLREYEDGNGDSKSVSCYGISPSELITYIKEALS